jgi:hypothetical protein
VHGSQSERDRLLSMPQVLGGGFDVYLTTYETVLTSGLKLKIDSAPCMPRPSLSLS